MEPKRKQFNKKKFIITAGVILAALLLIMLALYFIADAFLDGINRIDPNQTYPMNDPDSLFEESEPIETDPVTEQAETIFKGTDTVNILLVGQDRRAHEGEGPQRTDAMILCTINKSTKTLTMTSFMRDLWVYIPEMYNQRLNMPYKLGGFPLLNDTLDYNFGISADYNVEIDFSGFMEAIDIIGGVEIELKIPATPQTGDDFSAVLFIGLMVLSSFGLAAVIVCKKREEEAQTQQ